jgi:hypothetical protein
MGSKHIECGIGGSVLIAQVFNQFVGFGKHGIEESRRVHRALTICKCDSYGVPKPQRFHDSGNCSISFHLSIIDNQTKSNQFSIRHKKTVLGHHHMPPGPIPDPKPAA